MKLLKTIIFLLLCSTSAWAQKSPVGIVSAQDTLKNLQVGIVSSIALDQGRGLQMSGFSNLSVKPLRGAQLCGVSNISAGLEKGLQVSTLLNVSSGYMRGMQAAAVNFADSLNGIQIGVLNIARSHPKGWQVGIYNVTRDTIAHKIGLVNVNPNTIIDYMLYGGTTTKGNGAVRFRNRSTYNILGVGTHYMGLDEKFSGALFYRIGQYFQLTPKWSVSGDLGYYHIETFQRHNAEKPERLYSLQARLNVDYQISEHLGAFASVGYGDTRYYHHSTRYRDRMLFEAGLTLRQTRNAPSALRRRTDDAYAETTDSLLALPQSKRPWRAVAEAVGINVMVHCFDRFVLNEDFAKTTMHTLRQNFKGGMVWDNDQFSTNLFAHPYHGNLYFNSARSNGLTFWESAPFALGGSLMWEYMGEIEPPAINDLMATTAGGICIGEVTHRISDLLLNDRTHGFNRFLREAAATIIDPIKGLNRIINGDAWRVRRNHYLHHDYGELPVDVSMTIGNRYLADNGALFRGEHNPCVNFFLEYGHPIGDGGNSKPYDFFDAEVTFGLSSNQPLINGLHLLGNLWSKTVLQHKGIEAELGIYQHFNYYDSKPVKDGSDLTPYRISEAASVGPGLICRFPEMGVLKRLEQRVFLSGILLGGTKSDYYNVIDRDYNMGSGYGIKTKTHIEFVNFCRLILHAKYFHLYTWKGYEQKDLTTIDPLHLNAQGDKGNARLLVVNPIVEVDMKTGWSIQSAISFFSRDTHYKYYDDVKVKTFEVRVGLTHHF
ncbi:MAG: DUF3943 domain-containing protein [Prevotella sp.]|nr:DUF3943 domain-containing protein [Prevotella sp.]